MSFYSQISEAYCKAAPDLGNDQISFLLFSKEQSEAFLGAALEIEKTDFLGL